MRNNLELLLKLQVIDYDLGELERSKDYLPDMMENLNREIVDSQAKLAETIQQLDTARKTHATLDLDLKTKEAELQKYQRQMMSIKTNKEYDALVAEIDRLKFAISDDEPAMLRVIEQMENLEKELVALQEKQTQVKDNNQKQLLVLQEKIDSIGAKVSDKRPTATR